MNDPLLLCTDLDRTLLPNGFQSESPGARQLFSRLANRPDVTLVFVTGRDKPLVRQAITYYQLPRPDYVISDVGTGIYDVNDENWKPWTHWQAEIAKDWHGRSHGELHHCLSSIDSLRIQESKKQNTYKLSFYVPLHADRATLDRHITERLDALGVEASLIWSTDEPAGVGLLDIVPRSATKLHAILFLKEHLDITEDRTFFAGDSGNDLPVLTSHLSAVLVANAQSEVRQQAIDIAAAHETGNRLYVARGGWFGMNGNYSAGILEGLAHYYPDIGEWLTRQAGASDD